MGGRELSSQNGSFPFKTRELKHMQKRREKGIRSICYGRQLIVFKLPDKYINSTKTVIIISKSVSCGRAVPLLSVILLWMLEWNFPNGKYKCSHVHCPVLDNRFSDCRVQEKGKLKKFIPDRKYIFIKAFLCENMVSFKDFSQWNEFERFIVLFSTIRLKGEVKFFISRGFLEVFYLPSTFIGIGYSAL